MRWSSLDANAFGGGHQDAGHGFGPMSLDLGNDGGTPNDPGDADTGANDHQNFPDITAVIVSGGITTISGNLNSKPNTTFRIEFFTNTALDPTGFGEGEAFLDFTTVTTDAAGDTPFS